MSADISDEHCVLLDHRRDRIWTFSSNTQNECSSFSHDKYKIMLYSGYRNERDKDEKTFKRNLVLCPKELTYSGEEFTQ